MKQTPHNTCFCLSSFLSSVRSGAVAYKEHRRKKEETKKQGQKYTHYNALSVHISILYTTILIFHNERFSHKHKTIQKLRLTSTDFHENNLYSAQQVWSGPHTQHPAKSLHPSIPPSRGRTAPAPLSLPVHSVHLHQWCCRSVLFCVLCCMVRVLGLSSSPPLVPPVLPPRSLGVDHNHRGVRYFSHISTGTNTRCAHNVNAFIDGFLFISSFFNFK